MTDVKLWTINDIQEAMRAAGSHWWDPDTMRFFGTRIAGAVYQGDGGIHFVTSEKPPHGQRAYAVRTYNPESNDISGKACEYATAKQAQAAAKRMAGANGTQDGTPLDRVTEADQFIWSVRHHGNPQATKTDCNTLRTYGKRHARLMERECNEGGVLSGYNGTEEPLPSLVRLRKRIGEIAKRIGATEVRFSGDPRGCTVKLMWADKATNDFGQEGWCVPGA